MDCPDAKTVHDVAYLAVEIFGAVAAFTVLMWAMR